MVVSAVGVRGACMLVRLLIVHVRLYLVTLNRLSVDGDTIESAAQALEVLTTKPSVLKELKFLKDFYLVFLQKIQ